VFARRICCGQEEGSEEEGREESCEENREEEIVSSDNFAFITTRKERPARLTGRFYFLGMPQENGQFPSDGYGAALP
jgi:hypothetical protein